MRNYYHYHHTSRRSPDLLEDQYQVPGIPIRPEAELQDARRDSGRQSRDVSQETGMDNVRRETVKITQEKASGDQVHITDALRFSGIG